MKWRKKQKPQSSSNKQRHFWVTCFHCKTKLAIPPEWVFKYLERLGYEHEA